MKKIYLAFIAVVICSFCVVPTQAQRTAVNSGKTFPKKSAGTNSFTPGTSDCDTINNPIPVGWNLVNYGVSGNGGNLVGVNKYGDKEKAMYFDLSATSYAYISGASFYFAYANSNKSANLTKTVSFKVYADGAGGPGTQLGTSVSIPLSQIKVDVDAGNTTDITFPAVIALPASKKFYVSVDVSNFMWSTAGTGTKDSISVVSNTDNDAPPGNAWEKWSDDSWNDFPSSWGIDISLVIQPYVSTSASGCSALPVKLLSFNAERKNSDVTLSWKISGELNMKQYEIQRADNNGNFKTVATLNALNSLKDQSYAVTDRNVFNLSPTVQYRLKQVDGDGTTTYSRTITVKSNAAITDISFANPFSGALKLQLNLATAQQVAVNVYDMQGKLVATEKPKTYNASANTIILNSTGNLKSGLYVLKINAGTEQAVYKVVKN